MSHWSQRSFQCSTQRRVQQQLHTDIDEETTTGEHRYFSGIISIQEGTKLCIQPARGQPRIEPITPGQLFLLDENLIHGGCSYESENFHIFFKAIHKEAAEPPELISTANPCPYCGKLLKSDNSKKYHLRLNCKSPLRPSSYKEENQDKNKKLRAEQDRKRYLKKKEKNKS